MTATPNLPFRSVESHFMARSGSIYDSMVKRFAQRQNKRGRITQIGRVVPFTKQEFRDWLLTKLGGENGVIQCHYCSTWLSCADFVMDHMTPPARGGSLGLENLALSCDSCNSIKGSLTAEAYAAFREWALLNLDNDSCKDLFHRLAMSMKLAKQQRWQIIQKARKQQQPQEEEPF